jgi:hypothetical protein
LAARSRSSTGPAVALAGRRPGVRRRRPGPGGQALREIGSRPDEATARLAAARRLLPTRPAEGRIELERAIAFFREASATASLEQAKELLFALT